MDGVEPQLKAHFGLSLNVGLTEGQIRELLSILGAKVDRQKGLNAEEAFREVLQEKGDNRKGDNEVKTLIVFFSHSGNTRRFARVIQEMTGGDIAEIQPVEPYPGDYDAVVRQAKRELGAGFKPPIRTLGEDIGRYGTVFLGSPNWWSTIAPPLQAFLSGYDLSGKTIIPFITHGGGGAGRSFAEIAALCPNSTVLEGLAVFGGPGRDNRDEASAWLARFGIVP
jgi:flavodoxin